MSAHPASQRPGLIAALTARVSEYLLDPIEETAETQPVELEPFPVLAVVSAAHGSGATSVARMLAAELACRHDGAALVASELPRRAAPPVRAAIRLATAIGPAASTRPVGRICISDGPLDSLVAAGRYLAPIVIDVPPDGSAAGVAAVADRTLVVAGGEHEPALLDAVALVLGADAIKVANRVLVADRWEARADLILPEARIAARAAAVGSRAHGPLGAAMSTLADLVEADGS